MAMTANRTRARMLLPAAAVLVHICLCVQLPCANAYGTPSKACSVPSSTPPACNATRLKPGTLCTAKVTELAPTQESCGMLLVGCKAAKYNAKSSKKMNSYLAEESHWVPAVLGPKKQLYITDHHHLTRALSVTAHASSDVYVCVEEDLSTPAPLFWDRMKAAGLVWLKDNRGAAITHSAFPSTVGAITKDDPFRSLSEYARDNLGYVKCSGSNLAFPQCSPPPSHDATFLEFKWADFLRSSNVLAPSIYTLTPTQQVRPMLTAFPLLNNLVQSPNASNITGFNQDPGTQRLSSPLQIDRTTGCEES